jgi:hypothetical protein
MWKLLGAPAGARARTLEMSLLFVDLSGFTSLSERLAALGKRGAEELSGQLRPLEVWNPYDQHDP